MITKKDPSFAVAVLCLLIVQSALGAERTAFRSPSRRFVVSGTNVAHLISIGRWADQVADIVDRTTHIKAVFKDREFRITVNPGGHFAWGPVGRSARLPGGRLVQELILPEPTGTDWEDALEAHCSLLLEGYVRASQSGVKEQKGESRPVPAWLAVGLAHVIDPSLRSRDRKIVLRRRQEEQRLSVALLTRWEVLPQGRSFDKAVCTAGVGWLLSLRGAKKQWEQMFARLAGGDRIAPEWLVTQIPGCGTAEELDTRWKKWIDDERLVIADPGVVNRGAVAALRDQLVCRPGDCGMPAGAGFPHDVPFKALAGTEGPWVRQFCLVKAARIRLLHPGAPPELRDTVESYCRFLDAVRMRRSQKTIAMLLARADESMARLEQIAGAREQYMNEMERRYGGWTEGADATDILERPALQRYIDGVEQSLETQERADNRSF